MFCRPIPDIMENMNRTYKSPTPTDVRKVAVVKGIPPGYFRILEYSSSAKYDNNVLNMCGCC